MKPGDLPIFKSYPALKEHLPHIKLACLPSPIDVLSLNIGNNNKLYIKRDDISGEEYGGNKVRKLEFLLADALKKNCKEVITAGADGSNHCLATAIYAKHIGLKSISLLRNQYNAYYVRKNLLLSKFYDIELHHYKNKYTLAIGFKIQSLLHKIKTGNFPYKIPIGGSSLLGCLGFVNAAFELEEQTNCGTIPVPDYIYVACGTLGTSAGLILGLKSLGLKTKVISVRVNDLSRVSEQLLLEYLKKVQNFILSLDPSFPNVRISAEDIIIDHDYFGEDYAKFTTAGTDAIRVFKDQYDIKLDGTYTGKAAAAMLNDIKEKHRNKDILFWNTLNSRDLSKYSDTIDYRTLPKSFHHYFEDNVQNLDSEKYN